LKGDGLGKVDGRVGSYVKAPPAPRGVDLCPGQTSGLGKALGSQDIFW
jgi:hypothetical protein